MKRMIKGLTKSILSFVVNATPLMPFLLPSSSSGRLRTIPSGASVSMVGIERYALSDLKEEKAGRIRKYVAGKKRGRIWDQRCTGR